MTRLTGSPSTHTQMRTGRGVLTRACAVALFAGAGLLGAAAPATATPPTVDPATMVPALNPDFAPWTCLEAGQGIVCRGDLVSSYEQEPIGLTCPAGEVVLSGSTRQHMTRWHTADGFATKTIINVGYPADVFSLAGVTGGPSLTVRGHFNRHYDYPVPGDLESRELTEVGAIYLTNLRGRGLVLHDTGLVTYEPGQDQEAVAASRGIHDTLTDPGVIDRLICEALD